MIDFQFGYIANCTLKIEYQCASYASVNDYASYHMWERWPVWY
jgi:hypothetical protein